MEKEGMWKAPIRLEPNAEEEERGCLPFEIVAMHERQALPTDSSIPVGGNNWTVLDCRAAADRTVAFTIALCRDEEVSCWGKAVLTVADREVGARLLGLFADAFRTDLPR